MAECQDRIPEALSVSQCLEHFLEREQLDESEMWYCSSCKVSDAFSKVSDAFSKVSDAFSLHCSMQLPHDKLPWKRADRKAQTSWSTRPFRLHVSLHDSPGPCQYTTPGALFLSKACGADARRCRI